MLLIKSEQCIRTCTNKRQNKHKTKKYTENYTNLKNNGQEGIFVHIIVTLRKGKYMPSFPKAKKNHGLGQ